MSDNYSNVLARFLASEKQGYDATPAIAGPQMETLQSFLPYAKAFGAGAINPFNMTTRGLDMVGLPGAANAIRDAESGSPAAATAGGMMMPGLGFARALGVPAKETIQFLLASGVGGYQFGKVLDDYRKDDGTAHLEKLKQMPKYQPPSALVTADGQHRGRGFSSLRQSQNEGFIPKTPMTYPDSDQNMNWSSFGGDNLVDGNWYRWTQPQAPQSQQATASDRDILSVLRAYGLF